MFTYFKRKRHLKKLSKKYDIKIVFKWKNEIWGYVGPNGYLGQIYKYGIIIAGWDGSNTAYYCGLHEFGHRAMGDNFALSSILAPSMEKERNKHEKLAWLWALNNALEKPNRKTIEEVKSGLESYGVSAEEIEEVLVCYNKKIWQK